MAKPLNIRNDPDYFTIFHAVIASALRPKQSTVLNENAEKLEKDSKRLGKTLNTENKEQQTDQEKNVTLNVRRVHR